MHKQVFVNQTLEDYRFRAPTVEMGSVKSLWQRYDDWSQRMNSRRHLTYLDERLLKDVGLAQSDVTEELSIPFWKV